MSLDIYLKSADGEVIFSTDITHNLNQMAKEAGIYGCLWCPVEQGITTAAQVVEPLATGLELMVREPSRFKEFDATNGGGLWRDFVPVCAEYLEACRKNPNAHIEVSK